MNSRINLSLLNTYSLSERFSKASVNNAGKPHKKGGSFREFISSMPDFLASRDIKLFVEAVIKARQSNKPVILAMGAHPIKVGLSPIIIDLIQREVITAFATNGASIIHDFEIAYQGATSEDVSREIDTGLFGMARETGKMLNEAINKGVSRGLGIGKSVGEFISNSDFMYKDKSIFSTCFDKNIPATVHITIGADIIHMHKEADGSSIGMGSLMDFRLFTEVVSFLDGGVFINLGSAVVLPEVFLKALTTVRNLGFEVKDITTANFDFIQHYRPTVNVLKRPTQAGGRHFAFTGHHEIMFTLLSAMIIEGLDE
ncbi:MAG: hypothetical protein N2738_09185 [Thermodesulfovibrionales bacterium]|nr:hypothetical protein [Thermodesulfovibrionales bacterium]